MKINKIWSLLAAATLFIIPNLLFANEAELQAQITALQNTVAEIRANFVYQCAAVCSVPDEERRTIYFTSVDRAEAWSGLQSQCSQTNATIYEIIPNRTNVDLLMGPDTGGTASNQNACKLIPRRR